MNVFEKWKPITEYKDFTFDGRYEISNWGNVRATKTKKEMMPYFNRKGGYLKIRLLDKNKVRQTLYIHQLVAWNFVGIPNKDYEVNHKDGNKQNNSFSNLEWVTRKENKEHFLKAKGEVI